ncbi:MAG: hypothetical protein ACFNLN_07185, partial [Treponema socranskii subsp. buccale]
LNQCVSCIDSIKENKKVYQEYKNKTIFKDSFYNSHKKEIDRYQRARAFENMVGIATVNYPKGKPDCNGHSTGFDGIAYKIDEPYSRDTLIIESGEEEGIYIATFDIEELRKYRSREVHGNAYRQPAKYKILLSEEKQEPFIRKDYRKSAN